MSGRDWTLLSSSLQLIKIVCDTGFKENCKHIAFTHMLLVVKCMWTDADMTVSDAGWGTETVDATGYGKAPAPSRGGLANYRTRPYWTAWQWNISCTSAVRHIGRT